MSSAMNKGSTMTTYIAPTARVTGRARVYGRAKVYGRAEVSDQAQVHDWAKVYGRAEVSDQAQVHDWAQVYGRARVYGSAEVYGRAEVSGQGDIASTRHYLTIGPVGSEDRMVTVHRHYDGPDSITWGHLVVAGCWMGTLNELEARIETDGGHGWEDDASHWRSDYEGIIALARPRVAEWVAEPLTDADHARWAESE